MTTYTLATVPVSKDAYEEVERVLRRAEHTRAFAVAERIDMNGLALVVDDGALKVDSEALATAQEVMRQGDEDFNNWAENATAYNLAREVVRLSQLQVDPEVLALARGFNDATMHGPVPLMTVARLVNEIIRLAGMMPTQRSTDDSSTT